MFVFLAVLVSASSVTVSVFYDSTTDNTITVMNGDSVGVIISADSIFENSMNVKLDFADGSFVTNLLDVHTTSDSYSRYLVVGSSVYSIPGTYTIRATVVGASGQSDTTDLTLVVLAQTPGNSVPVITSTPLSQINEGDNYIYDVEATDADGDVLTYSLTQSPSWLSINSQTGLISGTAPQLESDYEFIATVKVYDGHDFDTQTFTITVKNVQGTPGNNPPVITSIPVTQVNEGQDYIYDVDATDVEGSALTYFLFQSPSWLSINSQTGLISGTAPFVSSDSALSITVGVSDDKVSVLQTYSLTVVNVAVVPPTNNLPVIISSPATQINEGQNYVYDVDATDADGNVLTYSLTQSPSWLSINSQTGLISGTAPFVTTDTTLNVAIGVSDGIGSVVQNYDLTVVNVVIVPPAPTNNLPVIISSPATQINEGQNYVYDVEATDADGNVLTYSLTQSPSWLSINSQTGLISGTAPFVSSNTNFTVTVVVSDGIGGVSQVYTLTVKDTSSNGGSSSGKNGGVGTVRTMPIDDFYNAKYLSQFDSPIFLNEETDEAQPAKSKLTLLGKVLIWLFILIIILVILIVLFWIRRM